MSIIATPARDRLYDVGLLLLRLVVGGFMMTHGLGKLTMLMGDGPIQFADPFGMGQTTSLALTVFAEVVCSFLIIIGLLTRLAVIPLIIVMAVAFFYIHAADAFGDKELSGIYFTIYVFLAITGSGRFSIDHLIWSRKNQKVNYYTTT
jgi:putative oxidoreductase